MVNRRITDPVSIKELERLANILELPHLRVALTAEQRLLFAAIIRQEIERRRRPFLQTVPKNLSDEDIKNYQQKTRTRKD
jgi:hypothetical protein